MAYKLCILLACVGVSLATFADVQRLSEITFCTNQHEKLHTGDFDGDGHSDLICHNKMRGVVKILMSRPYFTSNNARHINRVVCKNKDIILGDFNGDKKVDMFCHGEEENKIWYSTGNGITEKNLNFKQWCVHNGSKVFVGHFNEDNKHDLLCIDTDGKFWMNLAVTEGNFTVNKWTETFDALKCTKGEIFTGHFNGDSLTDVLCWNKEDGHKQIAYIKKDGMFENKLDFDNDKERSKKWCSKEDAFLTVADMNGDKRDDLVCKNKSEYTWVLLNVPVHVFGPTHYRFIDYCVKPTPEQFLVGDFNNDGKADMLCHTPTGHTQVAITTCM